MYEDTITEVCVRQADRWLQGGGGICSEPLRVCSGDGRADR